MDRHAKPLDTIVKSIFKLISKYNLHQYMINEAKIAS